MPVNLTKYLGLGSPPPSGGYGPICSTCQQSTWVEIGGGPAADVYHPNIDVREMPGVDLVHDFSSGKLPLHDNHASRIKVIHCINHLPAAAAKSLLIDCLRVLKSGGSLYIMETDLEFIAKRILEDGLEDAWMTSIYGTRGDTYANDFHLWGYSPQSLSDLLKELGYVKIEYLGCYNAWEFKMIAYKP